MNNIKITVDTISMHNITKSFIHKIEKFYNLNINSNYKNFVKGIRHSLIESGDIILQKLGNLQNSNDLTIEIRFDKWKHVIIENMPTREDYEKVEITFKYKNESYSNQLYKKDTYNFHDQIQFNYFFKSSDYCKEINDFIIGYNSFVKDSNEWDIFFQREITLLRTSKSGEGQIDRKVEVANYYPLSIYDLQYEKVKLVYQKAQDFLSDIGDHNIFKMSSARAIHADNLGLAIKLKLNTKNELIWCLSFQALSHEMYSTDIGFEKNSQFRNEQEISNSSFMKALSEAKFYNGIDFTDINEDNWQEYITMIDLLNY